MGIGGLVGDQRVDAFRLVDTQHVHVQCEEIADVVAPGQVDLDVVDEQVRRNTLDQRRKRAAQAVGMRVAGRQVDELPGQRGDHVPAAHGRGSRSDVAEIDEQRLVGGLVVDVAVEDLEPDQQPLLVLDDLGLRRFDRSLGRDAAAHVLDPHAERERHRRFDFRRERVIRIDVTGEEIVERQQRLRLDGDEVGRDGHRGRVAEQRIREAGADEIELALRRNPTGAGGRNDQPVDFAGRLGRHGAAAVDRVDARQRVDANEERGAGVVRIGRRDDRIARLIGEGEVDADVLDGVRVEAVVDAHDGIECLPLERELLLDLDLDLGADRILGQCGRGEQDGRQRGETQPEDVRNAGRHDPRHAALRLSPHSAESRTEFRSPKPALPQATNRRPDNGPRAGKIVLRHVADGASRSAASALQRTSAPCPSLSTA